MATKKTKLGPTMLLVTSLSTAAVGGKLGFVSGEMINQNNIKSHYSQSQKQERELFEEQFAKRIKSGELPSNSDLEQTWKAYLEYTSDARRKDAEENTQNPRTATAILGSILGFVASFIPLANREIKLQNREIEEKLASQ